jgi:hypothetical protein
MRCDALSGCLNEEDEEEDNHVEEEHNLNTAHIYSSPHTVKNRHFILSFFKETISRDIHFLN